jgi:archaellum component FlaC
MGGLISEIKVAEIVEEVEVEEAPVVAGINSQLEAVTKRLADIEAKFESQTIELNETKKGLGVALSSVEKLTKQPVAISLEKQKPTSKRIEEMTELEKFRAYKSK